MLLVVAESTSTVKGIIQIFALIFIFVIVLILAYWSSKLTAKFQNKTMQNGNIEIIETIRVQNNKYIQILKIADKYVAVGIGKDEINFLCELDNDKIVRRKDGLADKQNFQSILNKFKKDSEEK